MKKYIISTLVTFLLTSSISILLTIYFYNSDIRKMNIENQKLETCYKLSETKKKIKYESSCITGTGNIDNDGCIGYQNTDSIIEEYKNDLKKCLINSKE